MGEFQKILSVSKLIAEESPGHVFIGGIAVYLHAINNSRTQAAAETSHDSDLMISLEDLGTLRDLHEMTRNQRLDKHQIIYDGVEFDVYVERQNSLAVPYDEVRRHAVVYDGIHVAALEHLLILKLNALTARARSSKGAKDRRDVVMIVRLMGGKLKKGLLAPYVLPKHVKALEEVEQSPVFTEISGGNAHEAKSIRLIFSEFVNNVVKRA